MNSLIKLDFSMCVCETGWGDRGAGRMNLSILTGKHVSVPEDKS